MQVNQTQLVLQYLSAAPSVTWLVRTDCDSVSGVSRTKIAEVTLNALRTRQSLVKGERLVRHDMGPVLIYAAPDG